MDATSLYACGTAGYLALQSSVLFFAPRLVVSLLAVEPRRSTDLETYLSRSLGLAGFALAALVVLLTGQIPLGPGKRSSNLAESEDDGASPSQSAFAFPTVLVTTLLHAASAIYLYTHTNALKYASSNHAGDFAASTPISYTFGMILSTSLACFGVWIIVFGDEAKRISRSTGADKRTSGFPFGNRESAREKKKSMRKGL